MHCNSISAEISQYRKNKRERHIHSTSGKNRGNGKLSCQWHLQAPDTADWKQQYREIRQDIEYGCDGEENICPYASPWGVRLPDFAPWNTLTRGGYEDGEIEGKLRPYDELRDIERDASFVRHEQA